MLKDRSPVLQLGCRACIEKSLLYWQHLFQIYHTFDIEFSIEKKSMNRSVQPLALTSIDATIHLFTKYIDGSVSSSMPFKLYPQENPSKLAKKQKKRNTRGPYRKYSLQEKRTIIQRILRGQTLKAIAEQTRIPKRNLIRWKHEYLIQDKFEINSEVPSEESSLTDTRLAKSRSILETKQAISESTIKEAKVEL